MRLVTSVHLVTAALSLLPAAGCRRGPKTAEEAFLRFERAVASGDGVALYELCDRDTQKAVESVWRDQRLQRSIISAKFPEAEQASALAKLDAAAADDVQAFFAAAIKPRRVIETYRRRLGSVSGDIKHKADGADAMWLARQDGQPIHFKHASGAWAFDELLPEWQLERDRASHAVKTVRDNAALYRKAGP